MRKIPVGETISATYNFAFAGFLTVLGTVWLPYVVFAAFCGGVVFLLAPELPGQIMRGEFDNASLIFSIARVGGLIWLASIVVRAMVTVGLQERALGRAEGPAFFYFSFGAPVWRMIGAFILLILSLVVILILLAIATAVFFYLAAHFVPRFGRAIGVVAIIVAVCWYIYALVRLSFFLPAVVVAEGNIGLGRAWELGAGNFWRIVVVMFVALVPVAIGFSIVENAVAGPIIMDFALQPHVHPNMTPHEVIQLWGSIFKPMLQRYSHLWPFLIVLFVVREIVNLGLTNGAIGKAYVGVTEGGTA